VIDSQGYRANVGIILTNGNRQVFWGKRIGQEAWQFAQGGLNPGETVEQALFRELHEEMGLRPEDVEVLASTRNWLRYRLPQKLIRQESEPVCIGQKQKWFLLKLVGPESRIQLDRSPSPEFDYWRWVSYWYPLRQVVPFKREVYRRAMKELAEFAFIQEIDRHWLESMFDDLTTNLNDGES